MDPFVQVEVKRHGASGLGTEQRFDSRWGLLGERRGAPLTDAGGAAGDERRHAGLELHLAGAGVGGAAEELLRNRSGEGARCEAGRIDWV